VSRPRAADDFATIRARMEELRRERQGDRDDAAGRAVNTASRGDSNAERLRRARIEGLPPPWVPTIFVKKPRE
jgi:hypothetical protein